MAVGRKLFLLFIILFQVLLISGMETVSFSEVLKRGAEASLKSYPNSDTVLLYNVENIRYDEKGLSVATDEYYQKVLTESGRKQLRSFSFHFNSTYGRVEIEKAEIIRGGMVIKIEPSKNSKISIESGQMGSNIYDPANKVLTLSIPGLQIGDIVGLKIRRETLKARIPGFWGNYIALQGSSPILRYVVNVDAPAGKPLRSMVIKDKAGETVQYSKTEKGGRLHYRWEANNVPQAIPEPDMPPLYTAVQRLLIGTAEDWGEISRWYYKLCRPRLDTIDAAMRAKVAELIKGKTTSEEKIMVLFQFVSQQIRYMGITPESEAPGYEPHDVTLTYHRRYGVCRDKAALLVSLLEAAGLKAYPVLIMAGIPKDDDVPNGYFNHAVTAVETSPGRYILMDPTNESARELFPATLGNCSYLVAKPEGDKLRRTASPDPKNNRVTIESRSELDGDNCLNGVIKLGFTGVNDMIYRDALSRWTPEEADQYFSGCLSRAIPGAEIHKMEISPQPLRDMSKALYITLDYSAAVGVSGGDVPTVLQLPELGDSIGASGFLMGSFALKQRRFKLQIPSTFSVTESYHLTIPEHLKLLALPAPEKLEVPGLISWSRSLQPVAGGLRGTRHFSVGSLEFSPDEYLRVRKLLQKMDSVKRSLPVVARDYRNVPEKAQNKVFSGSDTLVLCDWKKYTLDNERSWVEESRRKFRILTYAGLKSSSEIHIGYNPVWDHVEISGKVTSPSGKVRELKVLEKNQMDASWNSSAPRYPGGKILVANLPGVEIGSEVDVCIKRRMTRPYFSTLMSFSGFSPAVERIRIIDIPERLRLKYSPLPPGVDFVQRVMAGRKILQWRTGNTIRIPSERNQPALWSFTPHVLVSSSRWEDVSGALGEVFRRRSAPESNPVSSQTARELLKSLPKDFGSRREQQLRQIRVIRDHVARSIRKAGPGLEELPAGNLSKADVTLSSGYGNSADRAILLGAMLRAAGFDVEFVPVSDLHNSYRLIREIGRLPQMIFGDVLVYLPGLDIYLNDTSHYAVPGTVNTEDRLALSLRTRRLETLRSPLKYESRIVRRIDLKINRDDSADIEIRDQHYGSVFESSNRKYSEFTPELRKRHFSVLAARFSRSAEITGKPRTGFDSYPGEVHYRVHCPGFVSRVGKYLEFDLPDFRLFAQSVGTVKRNRQTPFLREDKFHLDINYVITLPPGFKLSGMRSGKLRLGDYTIGSYTRDIFVSDGKLNINCRLKLPSGVIPAADCNRLFTFRHQLARADAGKVVLVPEEKRK